MSDRVDFYRLDASRKLNPKIRSEKGQFMTPAFVARFMASLFKESENSVRLLDPGAGIGTLTSAFVEKICSDATHPETINIVAYESDTLLTEYLNLTLTTCRQECESADIKFSDEILQKDFVKAGVEIMNDTLPFMNQDHQRFSHAIINPPYKKIRSNSEHRRRLRSVGIEAGNLYTAFLSLTIHLLEPEGELVAIVPRSFCNGPYFKPFRKLFVEKMAITRLHVFEARNETFKDDEVLQENVIFHAVKGMRPASVLISTSSGSDFDTMTVRRVNYEKIIRPDDSDLVIHVVTSEMDQNVLDRMSLFKNKLEDIDVEVSTGPVVDFRLKKYLRNNPQSDTVPLIYPMHIFNHFIIWPKKGGRKPNAILNEGDAQKWLLPNGYYTVVRRLSSKEEPRRIVAAVYDLKKVSGKAVGFENHLNIFHSKRKGLSPELAKGLAVFLNSTLVDEYFRQFSGHTQVNASDLKMIKYPPREVLKRLGSTVGKIFPSQDIIDELINTEIQKLTKMTSSDPVKAKKKIKEAITILKALGFPKPQQNERSALTLLAMLNIRPECSWDEALVPLMGITPIMYFCRDEYGKEYAPNTRETIRRQTIHQFVDAGLAIPNPDQPDRPINSPKWCYQISPEAYALIRTYGTPEWKNKLSVYLDKKGSLSKRYARERKMQMIPVKIGENQEIQLSPGKHSKLIKAILYEFAPRYAPDSNVVYIGDTADKWGYFDQELLKTLGVEVDAHGKMPDVVLYYEEKNWILLIEAVTSHGPVDSKRHDELTTLFKDCKSGIIYVTAFPSRSEMAKYLGDISWETEVWIADAPTHLIHFDGERFLGPYNLEKGK
ncbi:BsuBI/PstI family type II restriction endonuclease [Desulfonema magnum]|uniref:BsuBI/PstI family type II restriction endonuclease n=1 Tax=Desulfonema magnum TaxID=45655 RepID=UPI001A9BD501|nr:BsuBI/PstI family type II restriction endonuclease [Desulfonema magnum]